MRIERSTRWHASDAGSSREALVIDPTGSRAGVNGRKSRNETDQCSMCFGCTRGCFVLSKRRNIHPRNWTFNVRLKAFWLAYTPLPEEEERVESAPFARGRGSRASRSEKSPVKKRRTLPKIYTRCVGKIPGPSETPGIDVPADLLNRGRIGYNNCKLVELVWYTPVSESEKKKIDLSIKSDFIKFSRDLNVLRFFVWSSLEND